MKIRLRTVACLKCGHEWAPRIVDVRRCAKCKSIRWDEPPADEEDEQEEKQAASA